MPWRSVRRWIRRQIYLESVHANSINVTLVHSIGALVDSNGAAVSDCRGFVRSGLLRRHPAVHSCLSGGLSRDWL